MATILAIPLLFLSVRFSLLAADQLRPMVQLGVTGVVIPFMYFLAASGWLTLAATILALWVALARRTFTGRLIWSIVAVVAAAAMPLTFLLSGALF